VRVHEGEVETCDEEGEVETCDGEGEGEGATCGDGGEEGEGSCGGDGEGVESGGHDEEEEPPLEEDSLALQKLEGKLPWQTAALAGNTTPGSPWFHQPWCSWLHCK
jgi:hypothetical protein